MEDEAWQMVLMHNWIVNASPLPISLAVRCASSQALRRTLITASRFKGLYLQLPKDSIYGLVAMRKVRRDRPALQVDVEELQIEVEQHSNDPFTPNGKYSIFEHSSSLHNFTLISNFPLDAALLKFSLPWAQLTHLSVREPLYFDSMGVLVQCINLVHCTFGTLAPFDDEEDTALQQCTAFPSLTDAQFSFDRLDSSTTENFLAPLILPSLKKLVLQSSLNSVWWSTPTFNSFQTRSAFILETLELQMVTPSTAELRSLFESLATLKTVKLDIGDVIAFFRLLTWDSTIHLLPQLERLEIGFVQSDDSLESCIAMIQSREKSVGTAVARLPLLSSLNRLHLISYKATLSLDRWWWQWKLERVFPRMEVEFECTERM
jgi:hypothetical protein